MEEEQTRKKYIKQVKILKGKTTKELEDNINEFYRKFEGVEHKILDARLMAKVEPNLIMQIVYTVPDGTEIKKRC